jgi:hypothetical protein
LRWVLNFVSADINTYDGAGKKSLNPYEILIVAEIRNLALNELKQLTRRVDSMHLKLKESYLVSATSGLLCQGHRLTNELD